MPGSGDGIPPDRRGHPSQAHDWNEKLKEEGDALLVKFDEFFKKELTPGWETHRSSALFQVIKGWNKSRPFKAKVQNSFGRLGLTPPDSAILAPRDSLAHKGEIDLDDDEFAKYHSEFRMQRLPS